MSKNSSTTHVWDDACLRQRCLREARSVLRSGEAEDAVQEALIRAWLKRDEWVAPRAETAWLVQATRWEAIRLLDRSSRSVPVADVAEAPANDPELERLAVRIDVAREVGALPEEERELLALRYGHDLTQRVIADRLSIPEGTVKVRLHRLRKQLREALAGDGRVHDANGSGVADRP